MPDYAKLLIGALCVSNLMLWLFVSISASWIMQLMDKANELDYTLAQYMITMHGGNDDTTH